jgi:hypothetical protein
MSGARPQKDESLPRAPDPRQMDRMAAILAPFRRITQPKVMGIEGIPDRPALFVGNHTRYSFLDLPFMMTELWTRRHIIVRGLGDHGHYAIPVWRDLLEMGGMVRGTRANVRALMRDGQDILVFPGGANEVFKGRGQEYRLIWKERIGFARLAIEFGYPIVPFAAVGAEEMFHVLIDRGMPFAAQVSALMHRLVGASATPDPARHRPDVPPTAGASVLLVRRPGTHEPIWRRGRGRRGGAHCARRSQSGGGRRHPEAPGRA